ncbi:hypothetical protein HDU87_003044 [Geranomyces variabilis]|uniref:Uncharacterized protein n=1 Tax=Geranomyces variabilis TaxID=109894 RepID=A0AAD5XSV3_9FUNG|nr:hypothetical protein HDU87_003044 [Geranomyces variabilis]
MVQPARHQQPTYHHYLTQFLTRAIENEQSNEHLGQPTSAVAGAVLTDFRIFNVGSADPSPIVADTELVVNPTAALLPHRNRRARFAGLACACLVTDSSLFTENADPERLPSPTSSALLAAMGGFWGLVEKSQNLLLPSVLFVVHCGGTEGDVVPALAVLVAFDRVRPTLVSTSWMTSDERTSLLGLLAAIHKHCRNRVAAYRTSFPPSPSPGALEATLMLYRAVLKAPLYREFLVSRFREELNKMLSDSALARYSELRKESSPIISNTDAVTEGAIKLASRVFDDIRVDIQFYQPQFRRELRLCAWWHRSSLSSLTGC